MSDLKRFRSFVLLASIVVAAGCSDSPQAEDAAGGEVEYEGVSREQMESEASIMTIEEAESLGIVDTTIRVVPPMDPDSVQPLDDPIVPIDTAAPQ